MVCAASFATAGLSLRRTAVSPGYPGKRRDSAASESPSRVTLSRLPAVRVCSAASHSPAAAKSARTLRRRAVCRHAWYRTVMGTPSSAVVTSAGIMPSVDR